MSNFDYDITKERVLHSPEVLRGLGAEVITRLKPNMGHPINTAAALAKSSRRLS